MRRRSESAYLLLMVLAERDDHGYALARRAEQLSDGDVRLGAGTLYNTLGRLESESLIAFVREEVVDGRNRRIYSISASGRTVLRERLTQLESQAASIHRILGSA